MATLSARRVAGGTAAQIGGRVAAAAMSMVALRLSADYLGPARFGALVTATALVTLIASGADLGISATTARQLAQAGNRADAERILSANLGLRLVVGLALVPVSIAIAFLLYPDVADIRIAAVLASPLIAATAVQSVTEAVLVANGRAGMRAVADIASKAVLVLAMVLVVTGGLGFGSVVLAASASGIAAAVVCVALARRLIALRPRIDRVAWRRLVAVALPLGSVQLLNVLYLRIDSLLLSVLDSPAAAGHYGVAYKVVELAMALPTFFMLTLLPALAVANRAQAGELVARACRVLALGAAAVCGAGVLVAPLIVSLTAGAGYDAAVTPLRFLLVGAAASFLSAAFGNALVAVGGQRRLVGVTVAVVVANVLMNVAVIPRYGVAGAGAAFAATECLALYLVSRAFGRWRDG